MDDTRSGAATRRSHAAFAASAVVGELTCVCLGIYEHSMWYLLPSTMFMVVATVLLAGAADCEEGNL
jgi:hypothetical protein